MKLFGLLRKPDWESKNASLRERAVARGDDPALLARLPEFAQADPEPAVRIAALRRVDDLALLERRLRGELDASVAGVARERLFALLDTRADGDAVALVGQLRDDPLLQRLLESARAPALRRAALERLDKPALWLDRCCHDADAGLRLWALERISDIDALTRIADSVRKRDKRLARAARDKAEGLALAQGSPEAQRRRALELAEAMGRLARSLPDDRDAQLTALAADWQALRERVDADLQRRVDGALAMAEAALAGARGELPARAAAVSASPTTDRSTDAIDAVASDEPVDRVVSRRSRELDDWMAANEALPAEPDAASVDALAQQLDGIRIEAADPMQAAQLQDAREALATRRRAQRERDQAQQQAAAAQRRQQWQAALTALRAALDAGQVPAARSAREALAALPGEPGAQRQLAELDAELDKLDRWQRWSGNSVRKRLCDEAEALFGSGLHPDALATKVKELQAEWQRLDALEGAAAPGPEHGLTKRFRALCQRAMAPARPYFEKRDALRAERADGIAALLAELATLASDSEGLRAQRQRITTALRDLDGVAPQLRAKQGRALRERLAAVDAAVAALREQAVQDKRKLIARLRRDLSAAQGDAAIALAKAAQSEWKRLPRGERSADDAAWQELRSLIDPLFAGQREAAERDSAEREVQRAQAQAILDELATLAQADGERLQHASAHLDQLQARWRALPGEAPAETPRRDGGRERGRPAERGREREDTRRPPRAAAHPWQDRFDAAVAAVGAAAGRAQRQREAAAVEALLAAGELLDRIEASGGDAREALIAEYEGLPLANDARTRLAARLGSAVVALDSVSVERQVVRAELLAGVDSPAEAAALRREEQMRRLAAKLEGRNEAPPARQLQTLLLDLQAAPLAEPARREAWLQRWRKAWEALAGTP